MIIMIKKTHTRNQRRMYRIHKQEEQIEKDKTIIAEQQIELDKYKEVIDKIKEYLEEPNRDNFDFSKAKILEMIEEIYG